MWLSAKECPDFRTSGEKCIEAFPCCYETIGTTSKNDLYVACKQNRLKVAGMSFSLKAHMNSFGDCQRPVFSLGVSHFVNNITNLCEFWLNWSSKLEDNNEEKTHLLQYSVCAFKSIMKSSRCFII